jgi:SAM-dependent methyltransferase
MASVKANLSLWQDAYSWPADGDEWSAAWGGEDSQWFGAILPRIQAFVTDGDGTPSCDAILEIAPGFGRWTKYLKGLCRRLILVDLAPKCIKACRRRFASESHIDYVVNDGRSLAAVPDAVVDFVFSLDSLVHADEDAIDAYLAQFGRILTRNGRAFIHHSNLGAFAAQFGVIAEHGRARGMTGRRFRETAEATGLRCLSQEYVNWGGTALIDVFTVLTRADSDWMPPYRCIENANFMAEADSCRMHAGLYGKRRLIAARRSTS